MPLLLASAGLIAAAVAAQPAPVASYDLSTSTMTAVEPFKPERGIRLPIVDYTASDGSRARSTGIIAGVDIAPGTTLGVGFISTRRAKSSLSPDPQLERSARGGKKVAIGVRVKF